VKQLTVDSGQLTANTKDQTPRTNLDIRKGWMPFCLSLSTVNCPLSTDEAVNCQLMKLSTDPPSHLAAFSLHNNSGLTKLFRAEHSITPIDSLKEGGTVKRPHLG
jgi:hypothetical protein